MPAVERALARVAKDFFEETDAWRLNFDQMPLMKGVYSYPLPLDFHGDRVLLNRVLEVTLGAGKLSASSEAQLSSRFGTWRTSEGPPAFFYADRSEVLNIAPPPARDSGEGEYLSVLATVKPTLKTRCMPEDLYCEYEDVFIEGVLGMLMRSVGKNWSDPGNAAAHLAGYEEGRARAKVHANHDDTSKVRVVHYGGL